MISNLFPGILSHGVLADLGCMALFDAVAVGQLIFSLRTVVQSVSQFNHSVLSDSLWLQGLQLARLPCPSPTPRACLNSCPLSQWCHPTISSSVIPSPPAFILSQNQGPFQWVSSSHQVAKIWSFTFSINPSNEYSCLISFRIDRLDLLAVQGTLKSLLQHYSSKASILQCSAFFMVQVSHPDLTTGKTIPLTVWVTTNCGRFIKRWEYQTTLPASWEICMQVKKQQLELDMEQQTGSKLSKEYIKAVYCHSAYLASMQSMSCEMPGWMDVRVGL